MILHILNGDALENQFPKELRPVVVMRECMIEGPLSEISEDHFWQKRCAQDIFTFLM